MGMREGRDGERRPVCKGRGAVLVALPSRICVLVAARITKADSQTNPCAPCAAGWVGRRLSDRKLG
jgi:hypothetical protein